MLLDAQVAQRISMLRTILIMFVVLLHLGTPSIEDLDIQNFYEVVRFFF